MASRGRGGGRGPRGDVQFVKHTPKFVAQLTRQHEPPERARPEPEDRPDREDEAPVVVDADEAVVSAKRRRKEGKGAELPEDPADRFREKPGLPPQEAPAPATDEPPPSGAPVFSARPKRPAKKGPRAKKLDDKKLLSFDDE